jgi:predicted benzoate:H+ symporter BenE
MLGLGILVFILAMIMQAICEGHYRAERRWSNVAWVGLVLVILGLMDALL